METDIQTSISSASPIAAYGKSQFSRTPRILALVGCVFGLGCLVLGLAVFFIKVPVPASSFLMVSVRGGSQLPESFPLAWKEAITPSMVPSIVGIAPNGDQAKPYAIVWRFQPMPGLSRKDEGLFSLVSQGPLDVAIEKRPLSSFLRNFWKLRTSPAFIQAYIYDNSHQPLEIRGAFDGHIWHTDLTLTPGTIPISQNGMDLTAVPQSWPNIQQALENTLSLKTAEPPQAISWQVHDGHLSYLQLQYPHQVPTSTAIRLLGAYGFSDTENISLPDGTTIEEYRDPEKRFAASTSTIWNTKDGTSITIQGPILQLGQPSATDHPMCNQPSIFRLDQTSLSQILHTAMGVTDPVQQQISGFIEHGKLHICVE